MFNAKAFIGNPDDFIQEFRAAVERDDQLIFDDLNEDELESLIAIFDIELDLPDNGIMLEFQNMDFAELDGHGDILNRLFQTNLFNRNTNLDGISFEGCNFADTHAIPLSAGINRAEIKDLFILDCQWPADWLMLFGRNAADVGVELESLAVNFSPHSNPRMTARDVIGINLLMNPESLEHLSLSGCRIGDDAVGAIATTLGQLRRPATVDLSRNSITNRGAITLSNVIATGTPLVFLDLSRNINIGDMGAKYMARAINQNENIKWLRLLKSGIGNVGVSAFARAISENNTLESLCMDVSRDRIGNALGVFAEAIQENESLRDVRLVQNPQLLEGEQQQDMARIRQKVRQNHRNRGPNPQGIEQAQNARVQEEIQNARQ